MGDKSEEVRRMEAFLFLCAVPTFFLSRVCAC